LETGPYKLLKRLLKCANPDSGKRTLQGRSAFEFPLTGVFPAGFARKKYFRIGISE